MNRYRENTVNTKANPLSYGPTISDMRLSRLTHPRATMLAIILLAVVFLLFGMFAGALETGYTPAPSTPGGTASLIGNWVLARVGVHI